MSTAMKNYLKLISNFWELGVKPHFFCKIQNFIKSKRFDRFFRNLIPNVFEHWSLYEVLLYWIAQFGVNYWASVKNIYFLIVMVIISQSMNQFSRKGPHLLQVHIKFELDLPSNSWDPETLIFRSFNADTHTHIHTHFFPPINKAFFRRKQNN